MRTYYRKRPQIIADAERRGVPVYVLRNNTEMQMESYLAEIFGLADADATIWRRMPRWTRPARPSCAFRRGSATAVQLASQTAPIRRMQHEMAREANLISRSSGDEPSAT